jgi:hypothetical protein
MYILRFNLLFCQLEDGKSRPKRSVKKRETFYDEGHEFGFNSDPFRLVPVGYYANQAIAPFTVDITSDALVINASTCIISIAN